MQINSKLLILVMLFSSAFCSTATASLIGDTVIFRNFWDTGSELEYFDEIEIGPITSDDSDKTAINKYSSTPTIDFSESGFVMEFYNVAQSFGDGFIFNGYEISSINFLPNYIITRVSVEQNLVNWDGGEPVNYWDNMPLLFTNDRISFTDDTIYLDFQGLSFRVTGDLTFGITFAPVPVPSALWLFISGFIALIAPAFRKITKAQKRGQVFDL